MDRCHSYLFDVVRCCVSFKKLMFACLPPKNEYHILALNYLSPGTWKKSMKSLKQWHSASVFLMIVLIFACNLKVGVSSIILPLPLLPQPPLSSSSTTKEEFMQNEASFNHTVELS